jgi:Icc-related predicted phosphoesterase
MLVNVISDTHNDHNLLKIGPCDLLISCGDVGTKGNLTEALSFLWWFVKQPARYKLVVFGNHDLKAKTHPEAIKLAHDLGIIVLNNDYVEIEGLKIFGNSTTFKGHDDPRFSQLDRGNPKERHDAWKDIPSGLDLLITHMPPYGVSDLTQKNEHIGCKFLMEKIKEVKPRFHFFGHVHEGAGQVTNVFGTEFHNMACKNRDYILIRDYYTLDLSPI